MHPRSWPEYAFTWQFGRTRYETSVTNPERLPRVAAARLDGAQVDPRAIALVDDGRTHELRVVLGSAVQLVA